MPGVSKMKLPVTSKKKDVYESPRVEWLHGKQSVPKTAPDSVAVPMPFYVKPIAGGAWSVKDFSAKKRQESKALVPKKALQETIVLPAVRLRRLDWFWLASLMLLMIISLFTAGVFLGGWLLRAPENNFERQQGARQSSKEIATKVSLSTIPSQQVPAEALEANQETIESGWVIYLGHFDSEESAYTLKEVLIAKNIPATVVREENAGIVQFVVQSETFASPQEAKTVVHFLKKEFSLAPFVRFIGRSS